MYVYEMIQLIMWIHAKEKLIQKCINSSEERMMEEQKHFYINNTCDKNIYVRLCHKTVIANIV